MTHLRIFSIALICLAGAAWLLPSQAQPPKQEEPKDPLARIAELRAKLTKLNHDLWAGDERVEKDGEDAKPAPKIDVEKQQRLKKALEAERDATIVLLMVALQDAPNPNARQANMLVMRMLQQPIETKGLVEKVKLKVALEHFMDQWAGKLPILINR
jgi:hypothetical protein